MWEWARGEVLSDPKAAHFSSWMDCTRCGRSLLEPDLSPRPSRPYLLLIAMQSLQPVAASALTAMSCSGCTVIHHEHAGVWVDRKQGDGTHSPRPQTYTAACSKTPCSVVRCWFPKEMFRADDWGAFER